MAPVQVRIRNATISTHTHAHINLEMNMKMCMRGDLSGIPLQKGAQWTWVTGGGWGGGYVQGRLVSTSVPLGLGGGVVMPSPWGRKPGNNTIFSVVCSNNPPVLTNQGHFIRCRTLDAFCGCKKNWTFCLCQIRPEIPQPANPDLPTPWGRWSVRRPGHSEPLFLASGGPSLNPTIMQGK